MDTMTKNVDSLRVFMQKNTAWKKWVALALILSSVAVYLSLKNNAQTKETRSLAVYATSSTLTELVIATGPVVSTSDADLSFESSGLVTSVMVETGDAVRQGDILARLSDKTARAKIEETAAQILKEQASLSDLESGASSEERTLKQSLYDAALREMMLVEGSVSDTVRSVNFVTTDIVTNKIGQLLVADGSKYKLSFSTCDQLKQTGIETGRSTITQTTTTGTLDDAVKNLTMLDAYLIDLQVILSLQCVSQDALITAYKAAVSTARTQVSSALSEVNAKKIQRSQAQGQVDRTKNDLAVTEAPVDVQKIALQRALLKQAEARLQSAQADQSKNVLTSPFTGIVTDVSIKRGEVISAGKTAISVMTTGYQIEAMLAEVDIAKVTVGNTAAITLDAFGKGYELKGKIIRIDPRATLSGAVPRYKVIIGFEGDTSPVKVGMNSRVVIEAKTITGALLVPPAFITLKSGGGIVTVLNKDDTTEEKIVQVGIRGADGSVQILGGITRDDLLIPVSLGK